MSFVTYTNTQHNGIVIGIITLFGMDIAYSRIRALILTVVNELSNNVSAQTSKCRINTTYSSDIECMIGLDIEYIIRRYDWIKSYMIHKHNKVVIHWFYSHGSSKFVYDICVSMLNVRFDTNLAVNKSATKSEQYL